MTQEILNFETALVVGHTSSGFVYIPNRPQVRQGKRSRFMIGTFRTQEASADFRIWDEAIFMPYANIESGVYFVTVQGGEFKDQRYLTVLALEARETTLVSYDFLPSLSLEITKRRFADIKAQLLELGATEKCFALADKLLSSPTINGRFYIEGAAVTYHDNRFGGLFYHTTKMLAILATLAVDQPHIKDNLDLLTLGIVLHDIGKVFEYHDLERTSESFAHHRIRGVEFLAEEKSTVLALYDIIFYRHLQAIISGHHGEFGDRPTTLATYIIHLIDTLESQVTGLLQDYNPAMTTVIQTKDFGRLEGFPTT